MTIFEPISYQIKFVKEDNTEEDAAWIELTGTKIKGTPGIAKWAEIYS